MSKDKKTIEFYYEKSNTYRTYHVDGVFGGLTNTGIFIDIFTERSYPPSKTIHEIVDKEKLGDEINTVQDKTGVLRELECGLILDINTAISINKWLKNKIDLFKESVGGKDKYE